MAIAAGLTASAGVALAADRGTGNQAARARSAAPQASDARTAIGALPVTWRKTVSFSVPGSAGSAAQAVRKLGKCRSGNETSGAAAAQIEGGAPFSVVELQSAGLLHVALKVASLGTSTIRATLHQGCWLRSGWPIRRDNTNVDIGPGQVAAQTVSCRAGEKVVGSGFDVVDPRAAVAELWPVGERSLRYRITNAGDSPIGAARFLTHCLSPTAGSVQTLLVSEKVSVAGMATEQVVLRCPLKAGQHPRVNGWTPMFPGHRLPAGVALSSYPSTERVEVRASGGKKTLAARRTWTFVVSNSGDAAGNVALALQCGRRT